MYTIQTETPTVSVQVPERTNSWFRSLAGRADHLLWLNTSTCFHLPLTAPLLVCGTAANLKTTPKKSFSFKEGAYQLINMLTKDQLRFTASWVRL